MRGFSFLDQFAKKFVKEKFTPLPRKIFVRKSIMNDFQ